MLSRLKERSREHLKRGLCRSCPKQAEFKRTLCAEHLLYHRQLKRELRVTLRLQSKCLACGNPKKGTCAVCQERNRWPLKCKGCSKPSSPGHRFCGKCRFVRRAYMARARSRKRENGECMQCTRSAVVGVWCSEHHSRKIELYVGRKLSGKCMSCRRRSSSHYCKRCLGVRKEARHRKAT